MAEDMFVGARAQLPRGGRAAVRYGDGAQGIVHVIGPELGLTQPGMTIACGDSHTSTHGAFGAVAFGIGTSQVRDVLASQCLAMDPLKVRRIRVTGRLGRGVYAKDVILEIIRRLGVNGGVGYAYEYAGDTIERMSMDERMTICNMSIEGGARVGYVNPDQVTFDYLRGRRFAPQGDAFDAACAWWSSMASDPGASYDDEVTIDAASIRPTVTWGINPGSPSTSTSRCRRREDVEGPTGRRRRGARFHGLRAPGAHPRHADRRRVRRLVHEREAVGPARGSPGSARASRCAARSRAGGAGIPADQAGSRRSSIDTVNHFVHHTLHVPGDQRNFFFFFFFFFFVLRSASCSRRHFHKPPVAAAAASTASALAVSDAPPPLAPGSRAGTAPAGVRRKQ